MKHQIKSQGHFTIYLAVNAELAEELAFCAGGPRLAPHSGWGLLGICSARPKRRRRLFGASRRCQGARFGPQRTRRLVDDPSAEQTFRRATQRSHASRRYDRRTVPHPGLVHSLRGPLPQCTIVFEFLALAPLQDSPATRWSTCARDIGRRSHDPPRRLLRPDPYPSLYRCSIVQARTRPCNSTASCSGGTRP